MNKQPYGKLNMKNFTVFLFCMIAKIRFGLDQEYERDYLPKINEPANWNLKLVYREKNNSASTIVS